MRNVNENESQAGNVNVRLQGDLRANLKRIAEREELTLSQVIRRALKRFVESDSRR